MRCASGIPQGLVLGQLLFTAYMSLVRCLIKSHSISYHQFVNDTHLLVAMNCTLRQLPPSTYCNKLGESGLLERRPN